MTNDDILKRLIQQHKGVDRSVENALQEALNAKGEAMYWLEQYRAVEKRVDGLEAELNEAKRKISKYRGGE